MLDHIIFLRIFWHTKTLFQQDYFVKSLFSFLTSHFPSPVMSLDLIHITQENCCVILVAIIVTLTFTTNKHLNLVIPKV